MIPLGESVVVVQGEYCGLRGKVVAALDRKLTISISDKALQKAHALHERHCERRIKSGRAAEATLLYDLSKPNNGHIVVNERDVEVIGANF